MPRQLALLLCLLFSAYLLRRDIKDRPTVSSAIWIPTLWLMIIGSRPVTLWFSGGVIDTTSGYYAEGSPLDRAFYLACIFAAFAVLRARGTNLVEVMAANKTIVLFYLYLGLTVLWSDIPFPSFKRWFKDLGNVVVILVILTEKDPYEAMRAVFARCACVLIPLSVVFIKYFPDLGRDYSKSGGQMVTGVTLQKNGLGQIVMLVTVFLVWDYLERRARQGGGSWRRLPWNAIIILLTGMWLLQTSQSKTALMCLLVSLVLVTTQRLNSGYVGRAVLLGALAMPWVLFSLQAFADLLKPLVTLLGRDLTFTGRTDIWQAVLEQPVNPLFGCGFLSFWSGKGGDAVYAAVELRSSHNGFLEIYLDGGLVGLSLLYLLLFTKGAALCSQVKVDRYPAIRFALLTTSVIYNLTEGMFGRLSPIWFTTLLVLVDMPRSAQPNQAPLPAPDGAGFQQA